MYIMGVVVSPEAPQSEAPFVMVTNGPVWVKGLPVASRRGEVRTSAPPPLRPSGRMVFDAPELKVAREAPGARVTSTLSRDRSGPVGRTFGPIIDEGGGCGTTGVTVFVGVVVVVRLAAADSGSMPTGCPLEPPRIVLAKAAAISAWS
jgi:hypothetical protein